MDRPVCRRCLLEELGSTELLQTLSELKDAIPAEDRTDETEYAQRLKQCRECDFLIDGTCAKCGCYVEFRALKKRMHCPDISKRW